MNHMKRYLLAAFAALIAPGAHAQPSVGWNASTYDANGSWEPNQTNITNAASMIYNGTGDVLVHTATNFININSFVDNADFRLGTGGTDSFNDILGDPVTDLSATWEMVFRPGSYSSGDYALFDTGGSGDGTIIRMFNNNLIFRFQTGTTAGQFVELSTDLSAIGAATDFYHVVGVADIGNATSATALYVNGNLVAGGTGIDTSAIDDWDGGDTSGLGKGQSTLPGTPTVATTPYIGDIAALNFYSNQTFNQTAAQSAYESFTTISNGTVTVGWDATDYTSGNWAPSQSDANFALLADTYLEGSGTKQTGSTNFTNITAWVNSPVFVQDQSPSFSNIDSFQDLYGDVFTKENVSFETVFRPGDFSGKHVIYEVGGNGQGILLEINGSTLTFIPQDTPSNQAFVSVDLSSLGAATDFFHVVTTLELGSATGAGLYVNGIPVSIFGDATNILDWSGTDSSSVGADLSSTAGGDTNDYTNFDGDIAILNMYYGQVLGQSDVTNLYNALGPIPEPSALTMLSIGVLMMALRRRIR